MDKFEFYLKGKEQNGYDFADLAVFATNLTEALRRVHRIYEPRPSKLPRFEIVALELGSYRSVLASGGAGALAILGLITSIGEIRQHQVPKLGLSGDDIRAIKRLADPLNFQTECIRIQDIPIDKVFVDGCETILKNAPKSFGQAIGRIEGMNIHRGKFFRLYPFDVDKSAECYFDDELYSRIINCMGHRVRVEGLLHRDPDGIGIDKITKITAIEKLPENSDLPTMSSLFGAFKDAKLDIGSGWEN